MDIKMKHRIIGVVVIVALAVIIVPIFFARSSNSPKIVAVAEQAPAAPGDHPTIQLTVPPEAKPAPRLQPNQSPPANLATAALQPGGNSPNDPATQPQQVASNAQASASNQTANSQPSSQQSKAIMQNQAANTARLAGIKTPAMNNTVAANAAETPEAPIIVANNNARSGQVNIVPNDAATATNNNLNTAQPSEPGTGAVPETFLKPDGSIPRTKTGAVKSKIAAVEQKFESKTKIVLASRKERMLAKATPASQAWAIQLGTFNNKSNAEVLVKKLRKQGFAAYIHVARSGEAEMTRVYVGPELQREKAEALLNKLNSSFQLSGVVVKYQV